MRNNILVFGATGSVGKLLVSELSKKDADVIAAIREPSREHVLNIEDIKTEVVNYRHKRTINNAIKQADSLFLLLPPFEPKDAIALAQQVIEYAKHYGVKHIVLLSSMAADQGALSHHNKIETSLKNSLIDYTILRANFFMQNFNKYYSYEIKQNKRIPIYDADVSTSFIDIRDIAEVAACVLTNPEEHINKTYTLTGHEKLNHHQIARLFSDALGYKIQYTAHSDIDTKIMLLQTGWCNDTAERLVKLYQLVQQGIYSQTTRDVELILKRAPTDFLTYINDYKQCWV